MLSVLLSKAKMVKAGRLLRFIILIELPSIAQGQGDKSFLDLAASMHSYNVAIVYVCICCATPRHFLPINTHTKNCKKT